MDPASKTQRLGILHMIQLIQPMTDKVVAASAPRNPPSTRAGGQDDVSSQANLQMVLLPVLYPSFVMLSRLLFAITHE